MNDVLSFTLGLAAIPFPNFDPVAVQLGPVAIKWYGLAYLTGLILGWLYIRRLVGNASLWRNEAPPFKPEKTDDLLIYMAVGVILGGRLGYALLYQPSYFFNNPLEFFQIWKGGMAFHGALLGCGLAIWVFSKHFNCNVWSVMDLSAAAVPIGLFFGRIANFVNGELFGRPSDVPWAMVFPGAKTMYPAVEPTPRHPSQLYEAALEGLLLFVVLRIVTHHFDGLKRPGLVVGLFLIGYGLARSFCELFRQFDPAHAFSAYGFTPGIVYSIPMVLLGVIFLLFARRRAAAEAA